MSAACVALAQPEIRAGRMPKRGLLVDADSASLAFGAAALRNAGYAMLTALSAGQALSELLLCRGSIEFVIADGDLGGNRWTEVVASARALYPEAKVLTTTRIRPRVTARSGAVDDILHKPYTGPELVQKVGALLGEDAGSGSLEQFHDAPVEALAVGNGPVDLRTLSRIFAVEGWLLRRAATMSDALARHLCDPARVMIVHSELPDGTWRDLLDSLGATPYSPRLIVSSRFADERLWAEALNLGAFDVVSIPFEDREIRHVISHAWRYWQDEWAGHWRSKS